MGNDWKSATARQGGRCDVCGGEVYGAQSSAHTALRTSIFQRSFDEVWRNLDVDDEKFVDEKFDWPIKNLLADGYVFF